VATKNKTKPLFSKFQKKPAKLPKNTEITAGNRRKERSIESREEQVIINTKIT
jgi:hypothetical protein